MKKTNQPHSTNWLPHHNDFIREHQAGLTRLELHDLMIEKLDDLDPRFNLPRLKAQILRLGLATKRKPVKSTAVNWKPEHVNFLKENQYHVTREQLWELLNNEFSDLDPKATLERMKGLCYRKGWTNKHIGSEAVPAWNKGTKGLMKPNRTSFKKGQWFSYSKPVGHEMLCKRKGMIFVMTERGQPRVPKHILVWEKHHGRKVPPKHFIRFLDRNRLNLDPDNLLCVPVQAHFMSNMRNPANTKNPLLNKAILLTETLKAKTNEL